MELVKNKASGKYFVVLEEAGDRDFLVVTPEGKVKRLERHLFDALNIADPAEAVMNHKLTKPQLDQYLTYFDE